MRVVEIILSLLVGIHGGSGGRKHGFLIFRFQNHICGSIHGHDEDNCHHSKITEHKQDAVTR